MEEFFRENRNKEKGEFDYKGWIICSPEQKDRLVKMGLVFEEEHDVTLSENNPEIILEGCSVTEDLFRILEDQKKNGPIRKYELLNEENRIAKERHMNRGKEKRP